MSLHWIGMFFVLASSLIEAVGQLALKCAAVKAGDTGLSTGLRSVAKAPGWITFAIASFLLEGVLFSVALRLMDLSIAFPAGSLTFIGVVFLSRCWLGETIGMRRWVGIVLISIGTVILATS